jgi:F-type H+-transporting ATPase subunit b
VLTAVVTRGLAIEVTFVAAEEGEGELMSYEESLDFCEFPYETEADYLAEAEAAHPCLEGPSPLAIEAKELAWGAGAFIVLALLMRFWLFPAVRKGMDARYSHIRQGHEQADAAKAAATGAVADYEASLALVKAEASERIEAARRTLEAERAAKLEVVNAAIAVKREAAAAEAQAARTAVHADIVSAAADVASRTIELSIGRTPDAGAVRRAVEDAISVGVGS